MRTHNRKKNNTLLKMIVFIVAAAIFMLLSTTIFFNIEHISVTGSSNYTYDEIIKASRLEAGDNLIRTNTEKTAANICKQLVYIEEATISRSFPSTLVIDIEPSIPAANFICANETLLISQGGKILDRIDEPKAGLVSFTGCDPMPGLLPGDAFESSDEEKTAVIHKLMDYLNNSNGTVTSVDVTDTADINYTYDNRILVKIGTISDLDYKMSFSREIIENKIGEDTEGMLTILSDSNRASFLDRESLAENERVFAENSPAAEETAEGEENSEEDTDDDTEETTIDPFME